MGFQSPENNGDTRDRLREMAKDVGVQVAQARANAETVALDPSSGPKPFELDSVTTSTLGASFPDFKFQKEISRGTQGIVYQAVRRSTDCEVAIKVMRQHPFLGAEDRFRFEREARILAQFRHPNIVTIHESGVAGGHHYFVMEYIRGQPLDDYMAGASDPNPEVDSGRGRPGMSVESTLRLFVKICDAVNAAHVRGIIHRDLKPGNIRIDTTGEPRVLDFGLAKLATPAPSAVREGGRTEVSDKALSDYFVGTPAWASPEQAKGLADSIDVRSDVYPLGVILYQMLTGKFPYPTVGTKERVLATICTAEPVKPRLLRREIDDDVQTIVLKCLQKKPDDRYQSAGALAEEVRRRLGGEPILAKRNRPGYVLRKTLWRYRLLTAAALGFLVLLTTSAIALSVMYEREKTEADTANEVTKFLVKLFSVSDPSKSRGEKVTARELLDKGAERIDEELQDQPEVQGRLMHAMGVAYKGLGLYERSVKLLNATLEVRRRELGETERDTLETLVELGSAYRQAGNSAEAERIDRQAVLLCGEALGEEDSLTLLAMNNLALVWQERKDKISLDQAEQLYRQVVTISQRRLGEDHKDTLRAMNNLAVVLQYLGRLQEAEEIMRDVWERRRERLGADDTGTQNSLRSLADLLRVENKLEEAEQLSRKALDSSRRTLTSDHPDTLASMNNLGLILLMQERVDEAAPLLEQTLEARRRVLPVDHRDTFTSLVNLASLREAQGWLEEAEELYRLGLEGRSRVLGDGYHDTLISKHKLGRFLMSRGDTGNIEEAATLLRDVVETAQGTLSDGHFRTAEFQRDYGACLTLMRQYDEAEEQLLAAHEVLSKVFGDADPRTLETVETLQDLYALWERPTFHSGHEVDQP